MQISLCQFLCVFNGVGLIASGDQSAQSVLCLLGQSGNALQQFLLDRGIYTSGGDRGVGLCQSGAELDAGGDVVLAGHVDGALGFNADLADVVLILHFRTGLQFRLGEDVELLVQSDDIGLGQSGNGVHHALDVGQAAAGSFFYPLVGVAVTVEDDPLMLGQGFLDVSAAGGFEIVCAFQSVGSIAECFGQNGVQSGVGCCDGVSGADHTELEPVAGEGKGRSAVAVGGVLLEQGDGGDTGIQGAGGDGSGAVAADDGIMPQTIEAINHAKAANVPIIVAINKIDKDTANPDRVIQQLTEYGLVAEEWGGDTICVPVSAKKRINLDTLLEMVLLQADVLELKANPDRAARGTIIEAELDKGRGPVATVLVQNGTLKIGDPIVAGTAFGRVRAMMDDKGRRVTSAGPSQPVEVLGFGEVPSAGDVMNVAEVDKLSRQVAEERRDKLKAEQIRNMSKVSLDDLFSQIEAGNVKDLNIIVKADVQGTVEAIKQALEKLSNDEVRVRCIHGGVGAITGSDIVFASASNALVIGFNVRPDATAREAAEREKVDVRTYSVIYNVIEDVENAMKGLFAPVYKEVALGTAEVRNTFKVSGVGTIAGAYVKDGKITRSAQVRVVRGGIVLHDGKIASLKRFKDDVKEVASGYECGIGIENFNDIREGDMIEAYTMEQIER